VIIAINSGKNVGAGFGIREISEKAAIARKAEAEGKKLDAEQKKMLTEWTMLREMFAPEKAAIDEEIKTHRSGWIANLVRRSGDAALMEFQMFFQFFFFDVLGMLIMGMGLAKAGVFNASRSTAFYLKLIAAGLLIGVPLNYWAASRWLASGFAIPDFFTYIGTTTDPGRLLVAGAYIGFVMIACQLRWDWLTVPLSKVGRMALTNYLMTSILMTLFFNGYGLGYFAKLERAELYLVVLATWILNIVFSELWLRHYRFGPAEWLWRSLTYWQKQPMRRVTPTPAAREQPAPVEAS
jgi:uncharacterized protein